MSNPTLRSRLLVEAYLAGGSLRACAWIFGVSYPRAGFIVRRDAPEQMRRPGRRSGANYSQRLYPR